MLGLTGLNVHVGRVVGEPADILVARGRELARAKADESRLRMGANDWLNIFRRSLPGCR